jgi:hypothetical protein
MEKDEVSYKKLFTTSTLHFYCSPEIHPQLMFSAASMAYLQHSSKTIQTITHSNINGFPKDAVTMF